MDKLKKSIQCPFTWDIEENAHVSHSEPEEYTTDYEHTVIPFIQTVIRIHNFSIRDEDKVATEQLKHASDLWNHMNDRKEEIETEGVAMNVILHVMEATKYFLYTKQGKTLEAENVLTDLQDAHDFKSNRELATIYGCKSITYSFYFGFIKRAIFAARIAASVDPNCSTWQFVLGRQLRRLRREETFDLPCREEVDALEQSYRLSKNPYYGIHLAMVYRENQEYNKADDIYIQLYNTNPENPRLQLRLALGFIRARDFEKAKKCLDCAELTIPTDNMFLHYKGIYYQKLNNLKMAVKFFKEASKDNPSIGIDLHYAGTMLKLNKNFDYLQYLESIQVKYAAVPNHEQKLLLHTGIMYYHMKEDIDNSLRYLIKTIEMNPKNHNLFKLHFDLITCKKYNIFDFINNTLLPEYEQKYGHAPERIVETLRQLEKVCFSTS